ncbi:MAG: T9SS type A sorting domain-containing protein, partial [Flavobacteriales bacterium]
MEIHMMLQLIRNCCLLFLSNLIFLSLSSFAQTYVAGNIYFDSTSFVEYRAGNLPIIISASHGGTLEPTGIPDLSCNGTPSGFIDSYTKEIAEGIYNTFYVETGCYPHVIINHVHKKKFQPNANMTNAACGNITIEKAWTAYHSFIDSAEVQIVKNYSRGFLLDLHGHGHSIQRIELGYLLDTNKLRLSDSVLNISTNINKSSIRKLIGSNILNLSHADLLRGQYSFGTLLEKKGFPSIPSSSNPFTLIGEPYFTGGYITRRHGSRDNNGGLDAIQIEFNQGIRFNSLMRDTLIDSISATLIEYIDYHYFNQFANNSCSVLSVDINETTNAKINVYPNPTTNKEIFINNTNGLETIEVFDISGRKIDLVDRVYNTVS